MSTERVAASTGTVLDQQQKRAVTDDGKGPHVAKQAVPVAAAVEQHSVLANLNGRRPKLMNIKKMWTGNLKIQKKWAPAFFN